MNFPPKAISVLLLVQCLFIWMGYALTRKMIRVLETTASSAEEAIRYSQPVHYCPRWVLGIGLWALLIPLAWAAWVCLRSESHQGVPIAQAIDTNLTLILTILTVCFWSFSAALSIAAVFAAPYG